MPVCDLNAFLLCFCENPSVLLSTIQLQYHREHCHDFPFVSVHTWDQRGKTTGTGSGNVRRTGCSMSTHLYMFSNRNIYILSCIFFIITAFYCMSWRVCFLLGGLGFVWTTVCICFTVWSSMCVYVWVLVNIRGWKMLLNHLSSRLPLYPALMLLVLTILSSFSLSFSPSHLPLSLLLFYSLLLLSLSGEKSER